MKKKKSQKPNPEYEKFLKKMGFTGTATKYKTPFPDLSVESNGPPVSNTIPVGVWSTRDLIHDWKNQESTETRNEILRKAKRIAPAYSKGNHQYITEGTDLTTLGKKV